nr:rifin PIR protein,putative [Plasmodium sp. DRC-Itaito]
MKVHYINILLFALPLNILANSHKKNTSITPKIPTTRSLCECDLYMPNYANDPQMKSVMDNFNKQTQQRFHEYDERMKTTRQKCKERCDKEIQKIILKDKLEKELTEKFTTLETKITTDDIPTCICEKSIADKVEKGCLRCAQNLGGIVAPSAGVLGGIAEGALIVWKPLALKGVAKYAMKEGVAAGIKAGNAHGMQIVTKFLEALEAHTLIPDKYTSFVATKHYTEVGSIVNDIIAKRASTCMGLKSSCPSAEGTVRRALEDALEKATQSAKVQAAEVRNATTAEITKNQTELIHTICGTWDTAITASIIAIVVIVLIMVIIYLILRYRRKKKMKKKLQYIKLLEE